MSALMAVLVLTGGFFLSCTVAIILVAFIDSSHDDDRPLLSLLDRQPILPPRSKYPRAVRPSPMVGETRNRPATIYSLDLERARRREHHRAGGAA